MPIANSTWNLDDTIVAIASARGPAPRGIVRIGGTSLETILSRVWQQDAPEPFSWPRSATRFAGHLRLAELNPPLSASLYLWPGRRSYTGQPLAELHVPGAPPLLERIVQAACEAGARLAKPGEFTLRAFLSGRIDLAQAEAVVGVIDARGDDELKSALDQLAGGLSSEIVKLRGDLLNLLADLEAGLDFADEHLEFVSHTQLRERLAAASQTLSSLRARSGSRNRAQAAYRVVLAGVPNAGKSTLFNALVGSDAAIVSATPGTTRDYLSAEVTWHGLSIELIDTAGEEQTGEAISALAQSQRERQRAQADLILECRPAPSDTLPSGAFDLRHLPVATKQDLCPTHTTPRGAPESSKSQIQRTHEIVVSAKTGAGLNDLKLAIKNQLAAAQTAGQFVAQTADRAAPALEHATSALSRALSITETESDQLLLSIELREAIDALGEIVGAVYTDDLLDGIFSRFCIGK